MDTNLSRRSPRLAAVKRNLVDQGTERECRAPASKKIASPSGGGHGSPSYRRETKHDEVILAYDDNFFDALASGMLSDDDRSVDEINTIILCRSNPR